MIQKKIVLTHPIISLSLLSIAEITVIIVLLSIVIIIVIIIYHVIIIGLTTKMSYMNNI